MDKHNKQQKNKSSHAKKSPASNLVLQDQPAVKVEAAPLAGKKTNEFTAKKK